MSKDNIVKQSNQLARACLGLDDEDGTRGKLDTRGNSPWLERILNLAMKHINRDDTDLRELVFPISELGLSGKKLSGKDYQDIKASLTELIRSYYSIENVKEQIFKVCAVFSELEYEKGTIKVEFNKAMKPHLIHLAECFTVYEFSEFRKLGTAYAQKLFRFLKSWQNLPEVTIPLELLHKSLGTTKSLRSMFGNFRIRVLEPVHTEITERTNFWYEWEPVKTKNKVTAIRFFFKRQALPKPPKSPEQTAKEEHDRLQHESNQCYEKIHIRQGVDCAPKKRSKRCKYCCERGRMYILKMTKEYREQNKIAAVEQ
jgi:plasmid replication initiation protein